MVINRKVTAGSEEGTVPVPLTAPFAQRDEDAVPFRELKYLFMCCDTFVTYHCTVSGVVVPSLELPDRF